MYAWLWHRLPGPTPARVVAAVVLFALVVVLLFGWVFPWVEPRLPFTDVTVENSPSPTAVGPGASAWPTVDAP